MLTKRHVDEMECWQNGKLMKCDVDNMANSQNGILTKWIVEKNPLTKGKLMKRGIEKMAS